LSDPSADEFNFRYAEARFAGVRRRHAFGVIGRRYSAEDFGFEAARSVRKVQPEVSLTIRSIRPMTSEAVIGEDGTDVLIEGDGLRACGSGEDAEKNAYSPKSGHRMLLGYTRRRSHRTRTAAVTSSARAAQPHSYLPVFGTSLTEPAVSRACRTAIKSASGSGVNSPDKKSRISSAVLC